MLELASESFVTGIGVIRMDAPPVQDEPVGLHLYYATPIAA